MKIVFALLFMFLHIVQNKKLIMVQTLFRHGARYPVNFMSADSTDKPQIIQNDGELTLQGKSMHYLLGKALYKKYWISLFQETEKYTNFNHSLIYAYSTNSNRTIQSAQAQLQGLLENIEPVKYNSSNFNYSLPAYENLNQLVNLQQPINQPQLFVFKHILKFHPIPVHTSKSDESSPVSNPFDQGDFLTKSTKINCPKQIQWMQQNLNSQMINVIKNFPQVKQTLLKLSQQFPSQKITFQTAPKYISNSISMQYLTGQPTIKLVKDPQYSKYINYIKIVYLYLTEFYQPIQYKTVATNLFKTTINNILNAINLTGPKLILYSAHDTTLGMMLAALNLTNVNCLNQKFIFNISNDETCVSDYPSFASNLIIQVYRQQTHQNNKLQLQQNQTTYQYSIEMLFNNKRLKIPFCNYSYSCSVDTFEKWFNEWKVNNVNQICGIVDQFKISSDDEQTYTVKIQIVAGFQFLLIIALAGVLTRLYYLNKEKQTDFKQENSNSNGEYYKNNEGKQYY